MEDIFVLLPFFQPILKLGFEIFVSFNILLLFFLSIFIGFIKQSIYNKNSEEIFLLFFLFLFF